MKAKLFILIPLIILSFSSQIKAQYGHADNVVLFNGVSTNYLYHFSFDSIIPSIDTTLTSLHTYNSNEYRYAVFSDKNGDLKLYSDGWRAWNDQHQPIDTTLYSPNKTVTQNIAVPMPDSPGLIYIFSIVYETGDPTLNYSLINLNGNNGQGSVVHSGLLFSSLWSVSLALTKHANGRDYWLVAKKYLTNEYISFHIKPSGNVDTVFSQAGIPHQSSSRGYLKFSPNGKWLGDNIIY